MSYQCTNRIIRKLFNLKTGRKEKNEKRKGKNTKNMIMVAMLSNK